MRTELALFAPAKYIAAKDHLVSKYEQHGRVSDLALKPKWLNNQQLAPVTLQHLGLNLGSHFAFQHYLTQRTLSLNGYEHQHHLKGGTMILHGPKTHSGDTIGTVELLSCRSCPNRGAMA